MQTGRTGESSRVGPMRALGLAALALFSWIHAPGAMGAIIHVKHDAAGADNGTSWSNAYRDLQSALAAAAGGDEIWVARGTYKPTAGTDRTKSFVLAAGVKHYGGFAGNETAVGSRNWETHETVLSGDIGTAGSSGDNAYQVVIGGQYSLLDGFIVTGGLANGFTPHHRGAGMLNNAVDQTVANCIFRENRTPNFSDGGGIYSSGGSLTMTHCQFIDNQVFSNGLAGGRGGAMYNWGVTVVLSHCTFTNNDSRSMSFAGGAAICNDSSTMTLSHCTFTSNTAAGVLGGRGGAVYDNQSPTVAYCTLIGNKISSGNSLGGVVGAAYGGAMSLSGAPTVSHCVFSGNQVRSSARTIEPNAQNPAFSAGGALWIGGLGTVTNCVFNRNNAYSEESGLPEAGATSSGGGVYIQGSASVSHCTFIDNSETIRGFLTTVEQASGIHSNLNTTATVTNCQLWRNGDMPGSEVGNSSDAGIKPVFRNCNIRGSGGSGAGWDAALGSDGGGNLEVDPGFVDAANPEGTDGVWRTADDGLQLKGDSPCLDGGTVLGAAETDILGRDRDEFPDIGAYEGPSKAKAAGWWLLVE